MIEVHSSNVIYVGVLDTVVEVKATLNKAPRQYTVDINRKGQIKCGFIHVPPLGHVLAEEIPIEVRKAAYTAYTNRK